MELMKMAKQVKKLKSLASKRRQVHLLCLALKSFLVSRNKQNE